MGVKEVEAQQLATILANGPLVVDGAMATELEKKVSIPQMTCGRRQLY